MEYFLVPQAFALLLGATALLGGRLRSATQHRVSVLAAAVTVAGILASALALALVERRLWRQGSEARDLSAFERATRGGRMIGVRVRFVEWARQLVPPRDSYALVIGKLPRWGEGHGSAVHEWSTYRLLPRAAARPAKAEWLIFYGVQPEEAGYPRGSFSRVRVFDDGYAVARRRT